MKKYSTVYHSPLGDIRIVADHEGIMAIEFISGKEEAAGDNQDVDDGKNLPLLRDCRQQLDEYFSGKRTKFNLKLKLIGTEFQIKAWEQLLKIPFGETISYGEQARRLGNAKACRAVGGANGRNRVPIVVPCHRVIGQDGTLTGFGSGIWRKEWLLKHERSIRKGG